MAKIELTSEESSRLLMFFTLTNKYRADELECWERVKDEAPAANGYINLWNDIEKVIEKLRREL